jgi:hypothetical protein
MQYISYIQYNAHIQYSKTHIFSRCNTIGTYNKYKPAFDGFYTKIFTSTPTEFKLLMHYMNVTM